LRVDVLSATLLNTPTPAVEFLFMSNDVDKILEKLAKDVELAVHALYRGEMRAETAKVRTGHLVQGAKDAISSAIGGVGVAPPSRVSGALTAMPDSGIPQMAPPRTLSPRPSVVAPAIAGASLGWNQDESDAVLRCISAWLPMGGPSTTAPDTKCIPAGKVLVPSWGERSKALEAVRRISTP
jgi:hypothetical protein